MCECGCGKKFNIHNNPKSFFYVKKDNKKKKTTLKEDELYVSNKKKINKSKKNNIIKKNDLKKKSYSKYSNGKINNRVGGKNKASQAKSNRVNVKDISNKIEKIVNSDKRKRPDFLRNYGGRNRY